MNEIITVSSESYPNIRLRSISYLDQDNLRIWKNNNRSSFFYKKVISPEGQKQWFADYLNRDNDYMFIVEEQNEIGCMGIRLITDSWDIYNVILGDIKYAGQGIMSKAFSMMISFALIRRNKEISAKVLMNNPALQWYLKNDFVKVEENQDFVVIKLDRQKFIVCPINLDKKIDQ